MKGKILAVFSCCGKTHYVLNNWSTIDCVDHDMYDWKFRGNLEQEWCRYYKGRMIYLKQKFDYIFVNAIPEIIHILYPSKGDVVIYPQKQLKQEWLERAIIRNNNNYDGFPKILDNNWDNWIDACEKYEGEKHILLSGQYLSNVMVNLTI